MKDKKRIVIIITLLIGIITTYGIIKIKVDKKYEELYEVKLRKINKTKTFAIMIQNGDDYEEYKSKDNKWPGSEYVFNKAECIDNVGNSVENVVTFDNETRKATIKSNKTVYCTLYFDEKPLKLITNANKVCDMGTSISIELETTENVSKYYYSTNGKDFVESDENVYSLQGLLAGSNQKIYAYVKNNEGKRSETKEFDFTTKTLGSAKTASQLRTSKPKDLSSTLQGGMYRYQGTDNVDNWVMFGNNECTNEYAKLSEEEKIDKYMYRIIGITEEGQIYLLKETFLKEGNTTRFLWNSKSEIQDCLGDACEWPNIDLYKRLNGETSNGNPIFVDSSEYKYMAKSNDWYNLIENHNWMYGDTNENSGSTNAYNGDYMYAIETGKTATKRYWPDEGTQTTCSSDNQCTEKDYTWSESVNAKIGLLYMHDIDYAYTGGNPGSSTDVTNSWIFFQKDGYNTSPGFEWLITRYGIFDSDKSALRARVVFYDGRLYYFGLYDNFIGVRPVFYLSSKAKIVDGDGTKAKPYILEV